MQAKILPSRQALVDRIELQYEYGQPIICLLGQSGIGKSYLLESFVSEKYQNHIKSYVQLTAKMTDLSVMNSVLEQCFSSPLIDQALSFSENFDELFRVDESKSILIVLDNVHHCSDLLLSEFELVAKQYSQFVKLLLAANKPTSLSTITNIHLEPISSDESRQFLAMYYDELPHRYDPVFLSFLESAHGNPTLLLAWQDFQNQQIENDSSSKKHLYIMLIALLSVVLIVISVSLYVFVFSKQQPVLPKQNTPNSNPTSLALSTDKLTVRSDSDEEMANNQSEVQQASVSEVTEQLQSGTRMSNNQQDPQEEENALQDKNSTQAILSDLMVVKPKTIEVLNTEKVPNSETEVASTPKIENASTEPEPRLAVRYDNQWFIEKDQQLVMLQLIAVSDEETLQQFIMNHSLNQVRIYQTQRNNAPWWVVTIGPYQNIAQSQQAKLQLDASLLALAPFSKTIKTIQAEIARIQPNDKKTVN